MSAHRGPSLLKVLVLSGAVTAVMVPVTLIIAAGSAVVARWLGWM